MRSICCCAILLVVSSFAQQAPDQFEVASVRPAGPWGPSSIRACTGGPGTNDPGVYRCTNATITQLVTFAYGVKYYRIKAEDWMMSGNYNIEARVPAGATVAQLKTMVQSLLATRFHMVIHHETKNAPSYSLRVSSGGLLIKPLVDPVTTPGSQATNSVGGHWQLAAKNQTMDNLAGYLTSRLWDAVTNDTGLAGHYDFTLDFLPAGTPPENTTAPDLFDALRAQLGLRLDAKTAPADFLVIDHADKIPTEN